MIVSRRFFLVTLGGTALAALGGPTPASAAIRGIDHLVIMFKELETAVQSYRDLGFAVSPGGEPPRGTHNALIALKRPNDPHTCWHLAQPCGGFIDFCAATDDVAADIQAFRDAGAIFNDPLPGGRVRTVGYKLSWIAAFPAKSFKFQVPFFLQ